MSLWEMSVAGGVVILAVTVARALLLHRLPKSVFPALWMVAALRLLVPVSVPSPASVYAWLPPAGAVTDAPAPTPPPVPVAGFVTEAPERNVPAAENTVAEGVTGEPLPAARYVSVPWRTLFWAEGAALVGAVFALSYLAALVRFREAVPAENGFTRRWQRQHRLRRQVRLRLSGRVDTPMTYGLIRPVVLLPAGTDWRDEGRLGLILAHEYAHIRRWDALTKLVLAAAASLHWFNPLVWVMFVLANRDMELACDEQVLRAMDGDGRAAYADALIDMAAARPVRAPLASYFAKSALEERVRAVMRAKKPAALAAAAGVALVLAVTAVFATAAPEGPVPEPLPAPTPTAAPSPAQVVHVLTEEDVAARNSPAPMLPDEEAFVAQISREWVREGYAALTYEQFAAQYGQPLAPLNGAPERYKNAGYVYVRSDPGSPGDVMFVQLLYDWEERSSIYVQQWQTDDADREPYFYHTDCNELGVPHRDLGSWYAWRAGLDGATGGVGVDMQLRSVEDLGKENCRLTLLAVWNVIKEEFA